MKMITVTLRVAVEVPDDVDLDTSAGCDKALEIATEDVSTRGLSEIRESITDVEYGGDMRIILEAQDIPAGCTVCKPTGSKKYAMRRDGISLFSEDGREVFGAGKLYIQSREHFSLVHSNTPLAVDFEDVVDAIQFLEAI